MAEHDPIIIDRTKVFDPDIIERGFKIHWQYEKALCIEKIPKLSQVGILPKLNLATRQELFEQPSFICLDAQAGCCLFQNGYFLFDLMMTMADEPADSEIVFDGSIFVDSNGGKYLLTAYHWHSETFHFTRGHKVWDSHKWKFRYRELDKQYGTSFSLGVSL